MMIQINYSDKLREAYNEGATAMLVYLKMKGPKPDAEKWLERQAKKPPTVRG